MKSFDKLNKVKAKNFEHNLSSLNTRLEELDKLRGTGYWDFHYECLWHSLYKLSKKYREMLDQREN